MNDAAFAQFPTPLGVCLIAWLEATDGVVITRLRLPDAASDPEAPNRGGARAPSAAPRAVRDIVKRIVRHLRGDLQDLRDVAVDFGRQTPFRRQVYDALRSIPAGETQTAACFAASLGAPERAEEIEQAALDNPIAVIVPSHRLLAAGATAGGAPGAGLALARRLLEIEGASPDPPLVIRSDQEFLSAAAILRERDPRLATCMDRQVGLRPVHGETPYDSLAGAIVSQQLASSAADAIFNRLKALGGGAVPKPDAVLALPDEALGGVGLSRAKTASLKDLAARTIEGVVPSLDEIERLGDAAIIRRLSTIRGIGRWTVEMLLIFHLRRMDVFPADDYALRKSIALLYGMPATPEAKELRALSDSWRPYRTVASLYLWGYEPPRG